MIKILLALVLALTPAMAMTDEQAAYLQGIEDGYTLGYLFHSGLGNETAAQLFNEKIEKYNAWLENQLGDEAGPWKLAGMPVPDASYLPHVLRDPWNSPWDGTGIEAIGPKLLVNQSNPGGIGHKIDGSAPGGASYTTNDMNLLPIKTTEGMMNKGELGEYLGGI